MSKIKVSILNFHGIHSHLEVLLQDMSAPSTLSQEMPKKFYRINRWSDAGGKFETFNGNSLLARASSIFSFDIEADPKKIVEGWTNYKSATDSSASIFSYNCADSVQWFLQEYAGVPELSHFAMPLSLNHLALGVCVPSFLPCITLPGRVMDNAKFYINVRNKKDPEPNRSNLSLKLAMVGQLLSIGICVSGITAASLFLTGGVSALVIVGCVVVGALETHGLFKSENTLAIRKRIKHESHPHPLPQHKGFAAAT